ncbi:uncharacterized protein K452DRAFT_283188 [Aplosporella prunicola CBS 121167]|uniref:Inhibitor I9 domain-containing protein n=1 Tax=Aplosporella prunicola CBS 121167 TaxID=1176127 RepID=A0A6A6BTE9_9PEZI|nr:uncharacterized protein K452DRAFT_283188 [Aplosporella prunicola CBS 121167]KAF2145891.1 hypothetical protein K452DRAFT_283188 [Aplosporella prunicola CBS 121167]
MKLFLFSLLIALLATCALAAAPKRSVLVTYPIGTPEDVVTKAMNKVIELNGEITHKFKLIPGFTANAPVKALEEVKTLGTKYPALIEEDQEVHALDDN